MIDWDSCVLWLDSKYFSESWWWDRSKYNNDGVVYGAKFKEDSFYFDGNSYVNCGNIPELDNSQRITFEAIIYSISKGSNWDRIVTYSKDSSNRGGLMRIGGLDKIGIYLNINDTYKTIHTTIENYKFYHIIGIWTESKIKLWLNKKYIGSNDSPGDWTTVSGEGICKVGTWLNASGNFWYGFIKLIRIYKKELSEDEIKLLATMEGF